MERNFLLGAILGLIVGLVMGWAIFQTKIQPQIAGSPASQTSDAVSAKQLDLRVGMRKLWEDHITWTRMFIVSAANNNPDKEAVTQRLLKNQEDLGNAVKSYYGNEAGDKLTALLKTHITTAAALVDAAKKNDQAALNEANTKWYQNANEIADLLSQANPNWPNDQTRAMMKEHLDLTKQEAVNILNNKVDAGIADYDKVQQQILTMADMLSSGIIKQFPDKF